MTVRCGRIYLELIRPKFSSSDYITHSNTRPLARSNYLRPFGLKSPIACRIQLGRNLGTVTTEQPTGSALTLVKERRWSQKAWGCGVISDVPSLLIYEHERSPRIFSCLPFCEIFFVLLYAASEILGCKSLGDGTFTATTLVTDIWN